MLEPVVTAIEVPCDQERAFSVFADMGRWWPLDKRSMSIHRGSPARSLSVEPKVGGRIVETASDGIEHHWGTIETYEPPSMLAFSFHMGMPASMASSVIVRFTSLAADRTRVEVTQSNWEAFGDMAEMMRGSYGSSWSLILDPYITSCPASGTD